MSTNILTRRTIPPYLDWLSYLSWFKYGFEALSINQWKGWEDYCLDPICNNTVNVEDEVMNYLGFNVVSRHETVYTQTLTGTITTLLSLTEHEAKAKVIR